MASRSSGPSALAAALALLTGRALTGGEVAARLRRRGFGEEEVAATCARLAELGCLDDRRTAAAWAQSASRVRGLGPRRVREGLVRRRLPREIAEEATAQAFGAGEELSLAREVLARWERAKGPADDSGRRRTAYVHLRRRGFSSAAARAALFNRPETE